MLRELLIGEAMHALGIPTARALAVIATGERIARDGGMLPGAVLTRVASSHLRVGTFEFAARLGDAELLRGLADHAIARHYPDLADVDRPYAAFYQRVVDAQATLVARWMLVGFIHGVMNTDNMTVSGETIDYGPCAFMDAYDPATVFSSIDSQGRYAYGNQPAIAQWNLARLAEAMLPLFDPDTDRAVARATASLERFAVRFEQHWLDGARAKLGLFTEEADDRPLVLDLLAWMERRSADFTNTFRALSSLTAPAGLDDAELDAWRQRWQARRGRQPQSLDESNALMRRHNPVVIPRNHKVEAALEAATIGHDLGPMRALLEVLATPFDHCRDVSGYGTAPAGALPYRTFCGT
jgi:uncharacterized protein YdiU (UPF0061 family)